MLVSRGWSGKALGERKSAFHAVVAAIRCRCDQWAGPKHHIPRRFTCLGHEDLCTRPGLQTDPAPPELEDNLHCPHSRCRPRHDHQKYPDAGRIRWLPQQIVDFLDGRRDGVAEAAPLVQRDEGGREVVVVTGQPVRRATN